MGIGVAERFPHTSASKITNIACRANGLNMRDVHDGGKASSQLLEDMTNFAAFLSAQASPKTKSGAVNKLSSQCSQKSLLETPALWGSVKKSAEIGLSRQGCLRGAEVCFVWGLGWQKGFHTLRRVRSQTSLVGQMAKSHDKRSSLVPTCPERSDSTFLVWGVFISLSDAPCCLTLCGANVHGASSMLSRAG